MLYRNWVWCQYNSVIALLFENNPASYIIKITILKYLAWHVLVLCMIFIFGMLMLMCMVRVANSHAYGVILTHLTCYSRTHAIDKFTHAFKKNHTHTHAIL